MDVCFQAISEPDKNIGLMGLSRILLRDMANVCDFPQKLTANWQLGCLVEDKEIL